MIGYITLGTNKLSAAAAFYDAVLGQLGATRSRSSAELVGWRFPAGGGELYVLKPYDGNAAIAGNSPMVGLHTGNRTLVDAVYASLWRHCSNVTLRLSFLQQGERARTSTPPVSRKREESVPHCCPCAFQTRPSSPKTNPTTPSKTFDTARQRSIGTMSLLKASCSSANPTTPAGLGGRLQRDFPE